MKDWCWSHVVIEIFPDFDTGEWPKEGNAADWIEKGLIGWCLGEDDTAVYFMPMRKILKIKLAQLWEAINGFFYNKIYARTSWGRRRIEKSHAEFLAMFEND